MIELFQFPPTDGASSMSPFCIKVEAYLRMVQIPYENRFIFNPSRSPKGKLPFVRDGNICVADSHLILNYLKTKYGDPLDSKLSQLERATALAFQRLIEEDLYWALLFSRWGDPDGFKHISSVIGPQLPLLMRPLILKMIRNKLLAQARGHGMGRHKPEEIVARGIEDLKAIRDFLGNKTFAFGESPSSLDAVIYGFLEPIRHAPPSNPFQRFIHMTPEFLRYGDHFRATYFSS